MQSSTAESLALINTLTKISNSPILLKATADKAKATGGNPIKRAGMDEALKLLPQGARVEDVSMSGLYLWVSRVGFSLMSCVCRKTCRAIQSFKDHTHG